MATSSKLITSNNCHRQLINLVMVIWFATFFTSCTIIKPGSYFRNLTRDTTISNITPLPADIVIKTGDILSISISSLSKEEDALYSIKSSVASSTVAGTGSGGGTDNYTVTEDGFVQLHKLGKIKAAGLTRKQLKASIETALFSYLKDAIVSITFADHHVTVMGEIGKQQVLPVPNESITVIDALANSGNVTAVAKLTDVIVIRTNGTSKDIKHINLEDHTVFSSPYYYLQPNDIVVVGSDDRIVKQQLKREKYQQYSAIVFQSISVALIIYQVFFRR